MRTIEGLLWGERRSSGRVGDLVLVALLSLAAGQVACNGYMGGPGDPSPDGGSTPEPDGDGDTDVDADGDTDADADTDVDADADGCVPDCGGRECGMDPVCGTLSCGSCGSGQECSPTGVCDCVPDCGGRQCGMDPVCGTLSCGSCGSGESCSPTGVCDCVPDCGSRQCGMDPVCETLSCGSCGSGEACSSAGMCECAPDCGGRECGMDPVCGTLSCGSCGSGETCNASGMCDCIPDCGGRECGMDPVCGTLSCGSCGSGERCDSGGNCVPDSPTGGILADHESAAAYESIPSSWLDAARTDLDIFYGHTSHGSQLMTGLDMLGVAEPPIAEISADLGHLGDTSWATTTRSRLAADPSINVVVWSWCGGVSDNTAAGIQTYLDTMDALESDYPSVTFVYMTGHLDGSGPSGNLYVRNDEIRTYCADNDKILFDFADIESYDPDGTYYPWENDGCDWCSDWCSSHSCPSCGSCAHSHCFNCYQKGRAFWWLLARIAGWSGA